MLRIIEDLMSLSRIEADRFVAPASSVDVARSFERPWTTSVMRGGGHAANSGVDLADDLPPVRGDRAQLVQVLDNLISNAVRYGCDRPGSTIDIAVERTALGRR